MGPVRWKGHGDGLFYRYRYAPEELAVPNSKERTVGLGPGIQLGGQGIWFRVNSYIETDVGNRPSGVMVTLRISKALAAKKPNN